MLRDHLSSAARCGAAAVCEPSVDQNRIRRIPDWTLSQALKAPFTLTEIPPKAG